MSEMIFAGSVASLAAFACIIAAISRHLTLCEETLFVIQTFSTALPSGTAAISSITLHQVEG
jgi:hypothetical protein